MARSLRWYLPEVLYEVTTRTIQERFLLRPGPDERACVLGVLGRALALYQTIRLYAFVFLSNHAHLLLSAGDAGQIAPFIGHVNGHVARKMGERHGWRGPFWASRASVIPVLDEASHEGRLRYILSHGVKEGLVERPEEWPGASSTPALLGERLTGRWPIREGAAPHKARRSGPDATECAIPIAPLPAWRHLEPVERIRRVRTLIDEIVAAHSRPIVLGAPAVCTQAPHDRPDAPSRNPAPRCHTATAALRRAYRRSYSAFAEAYRRVARSERSPRELPGGCHLPGHSFVPPACQDPPWHLPAFGDGAGGDEQATSARVRASPAARPGARTPRPPPPRRARARPTAGTIPPLDLGIPPVEPARARVSSA